MSQSGNFYVIPISDIFHQVVGCGISADYVKSMVYSFVRAIFNVIHHIKPNFENNKYISEEVERYSTGKSKEEIIHLTRLLYQLWARIDLYRIYLEELTPYAKIIIINIKFNDYDVVVQLPITYKFKYQ